MTNDVRERPVYRLFARGDGRKDRADRWWCHGVFYDLGRAISYAQEKGLEGAFIC